jgi:hypothetical protein
MIKTKQKTTWDQWLMRMSKPSEVEVLQVGNVAGLGDYLGLLNPNPLGGVATVHIVVSAA